MNTFVKPVVPGKQEAYKRQDKEPFRLPSPGKGKKEIYITTIKADSPFEDEYFDGVCFAKKTLPVEASLVTNEGKYFPYRYPTYFLTEQQAKSIISEAKKRTKLIPTRPNILFGTKEDRHGKEYFNEETIIVGDFLVLEKASDFNPYQKDFLALRETVEEMEKNQEEKMEENIYKGQKGK